MGWLKSQEAKRVAVWVGFFATMYLLRSFYSIILGTFILTLLGNQAVNVGERGWAAATKRLRSRRPQWEAPAWLVAKLPRRLPRKAFSGAYIFAVMACLVTSTVLVVPRSIKEGQFVVSRIANSEDPYKYLAETLHDILGDGATGQLENYLHTQANSAGSLSDQIFKVEPVQMSARELLRVQSDIAKGNWSPDRAAGLATQLQRLFKTNVVQGLRVCKYLLDSATGALVTAALSLVFSFCFVFDLPGIAAGVRKLKHSRLSFAYEEITPRVVKFSKIVGTAFEIQILLAVINTLLTGVGLLYLKIPAAGFLSLIVFFCSFIPVAGIVMSTIPISIVALSEFGAPMLIKVLGMVAGVHLFEAWTVYPPLYAYKLKLPTLLVLVALYVTEQAVGVQGLFLALPVTVFLVDLIKMSDAKGKQSNATISETTSAP